MLHSALKKMCTRYGDRPRTKNGLRQEQSGQFLVTAIEAEARLWACSSDGAINVLEPHYLELLRGPLPTALVSVGYFLFQVSTKGGATSADIKPGAGPRCDRCDGWTFPSLRRCFFSSADVAAATALWQFRSRRRSATPRRQSSTRYGRRLRRTFPPAAGER